MARPLKYSDPEKLEKVVDDYFKDNDRPTLSGLALHLGFNSRKTLYNYKERDEFLHIIKRASAIVESKYEERLIYENNPTGVIFALKNMGWDDKRSHSIDGNLNITKIPVERVEPDGKS